MSDEPKIIGIDKRYYPAQATVLGHPGFWVGNTIIDQSENPPPTFYVLVEGDIGDYAAYVGHGDPEWVARHGVVGSFEFYKMSRCRCRDYSR